MGRWKKTKCFVRNLSLHKSNKKLIGVLLKKKMSSTTQGKTMPVQWILLEPPLKLSNVPKERPFVLRNNLREKLSSSLKTRPVQKPRLLSRLEYLSVKLHHFLEKLKRAKPFWMVLTVLNANSRETLLMHVVQ